MHAEALAYVTSTIGERTFPTVIELGSRNVNGGVRHLFNGARYTGVDIVAGPDVDVVADAARWTTTDLADLVICCEVLEHTPAAADIVASAGRATKPGGMVIITAAGPGRAPHSAVDGGPLRPGEHYANIAPGDLTKWLSAIGSATVEVNPAAGDVYGMAVKEGRCLTS